MINVLVSFLDRRHDENLAWFARRSLGFALDRFAARIAEIRLRVRDENGPRGGLDQTCSLAIRLQGAKELHLQDRDSAAEKAIHRLARRAARTLARDGGKRRSSRRPA